MCDGAPPDFHLAVGEFLNDLLPEKWIGRSGLTAWPALSPDLNSLLFYPWGHLFYVYVTEVSDVQNVQLRIQNGFEMTRMTPGIFQRVWHSLLRRVMSCV